MEKKKHYGKELKNIIEEHELKFSYLCRRMEISRHKLNKNLKDGLFKQYQKDFIDKLKVKLNEI